MIYITKNSNLQNMPGWEDNFDRIYTLATYPERSLNLNPKVRSCHLSMNRYQFLALRCREHSDTVYEYFRHTMVPDYLRALVRNHSAMAFLEGLHYADEHGVNILMFCHCAHECTCIRSVVAGILQGYGCDVRGVSEDYTTYYKSFIRQK